MSEIGVSTPSLRSWYFTHVSQIPHVLSKPWFHDGMYEVFKYNLGCGFFSPPLTLILLQLLRAEWQEVQ